MLQPNDTVLFQGDSITDAGRDREMGIMKGWGQGYAMMTACALRANLPAYDLTVHNRGISGDRVPDLAERWDADCLALKPDLVSILIGVNDEWRFHGGGVGTELADYEKGYRDLIARTTEAFGDVKLVLCEPFVLRCGAVTDAWFPQFDERRKIVERLAIESEAVFVPFQAIFDAAVEHAEPAYWAQDGVHPSMAGHQLMSQNWLKIVVGE